MGNLNANVISTGTFKHQQGRERLERVEMWNNEDNKNAARQKHKNLRRVEVYLKREKSLSMLFSSSIKPSHYVENDERKADNSVRFAPCAQRR